MFLFGRCDVCGDPGLGLCGVCRAGLTPAPPVDLAPELDSVGALFAYADLGADVIRATKFANRRTALGVLVHSAVPSLAGRFDSVVPVPPDPRRRRSRGYDLPALVATAVGRALRLPVHTPLARLDRGSQIRRGRAARSQLDGYRAVRTVAGRVLLVDDVVTTGATARNCAVELRRVGASSVSLWALAATPAPQRARSFSPTPTATIDEDSPTRR